MRLTHQEQAERQIRRGMIGGQEAIYIDLCWRHLLELCVQSPPCDLDVIAWRYHYSRHALTSLIDRIRRLRLLGKPDAPAEPLWRGPMGLEAIRAYRIAEADLPDHLRGLGSA